MVWDKYANAGAAWAKFEEPGDQVVGTIKEIRDGKDFNKNVCPELVLDDGNGGSLIVTAGQVVLRNRLIEAAPQVGDRVRITFTEYGEARGGFNPPKLFTVEVKPGEPQEENPTQQLEAPF